MLINYRQMRKIKVETQSGQFLGRLADFELETDSGTVEKYYVKSKNLINGLFEDKLLINKSQIISFDEERMVVEDNVIKEKARTKELNKVEKLENAEPVITSKLSE
jgi:sporulation protein YlmC with PRC-barrel domain